jgi:hypothetical protein
MLTSTNFLIFDFLKALNRILTESYMSMSNKLNIYLLYKIKIYISINNFKNNATTDYNNENDKNEKMKIEKSQYIKNKRKRF